MRFNLTRYFKKKKFLAEPWGFLESCYITFCILFFGLFIQTLTKGHLQLYIKSPFSIICATLLAALIVLFYIKFRRNKAVIWLSDLQAFLFAFFLFVCCYLLILSVPQDFANSSKLTRYSQLNNFRPSFLFFCSQIYLMVTFGMGILSNSFPLRGRKIGYFLSFSGIWLIILVGTFGFADIEKVKVNLLEEGTANNIALADDGALYKLPFSMRLLNFTMDEYNPTITVVDSSMVSPSISESYNISDQNTCFFYKSWVIRITKFYPESPLNDSIIKVYPNITSFPAIFVRAVDISTKEIKRGWLTTGSNLHKPIILNLSGTSSLIIVRSKPRNLNSVIEFSNGKSIIDTVTIKVNKPYRKEGWLIYQRGYDKSKGKWSSLSILEGIKDPWRPMIYVGFVLFFMGLPFMFWTPRIQLKTKV